jgi:hypothetical protein
MTENRKVVEFAGVKFYHEQMTPTYAKLTPVNDAVWMLRHCESVAPREMNDE